MHRLIHILILATYTSVSCGNASDRSPSTPLPPADNDKPETPVIGGNGHEDGNDDTDHPPVSKPAMVGVLLVQAKELSQKPALNKMNCDEILHSIEQDSLKTYGLGKSDLNRMRVASKLAKSNKGWLKATEKDWIKVEATHGIAFATAQVEIEADKLKNGELPADLDLEDISFTLACEAPSRLTYKTTNLKINPPRRLANWTSGEAVQNTSDLGMEVDPEYQVLYGRNGLGYGIYARSGLVYNHKPFILGTSYPLYNKFSIQWLVSTPVLEAGVVAKVLLDVEAQPANDWIYDCSNVSLRIANDEDMRRASSVIAIPSERCDSMPLFLKLEPDLESMTEQGLNMALASLTSLGNQAVTLDTICDDSDIISTGSCNQKIINSYSPYLEALIKGERDLFVEIKFNDHVQKLLRVHRQGNLIEDIKTKPLFD